MFEDEDWKIAVEDSRFRHNAILALIYSVNNQALGLLRLYSVIALAAATGAVSSLSLPNEVPSSVGWELAAMTLVLVWASWQCFRALEVADLRLPGRDAEFWLRAADGNGGRGQFARQYLEASKKGYQNNKRVNARQTRALRYAKLGGILSPIFAIAVGAASAAIQYYL